MNKGTIGSRKYITVNIFVLFEKNTMKPCRLNAQLTVNKKTVKNNSCQQSKYTFELCVSRVILPIIFDDDFKEFSSASQFYISEGNLRCKILEKALQIAKWSQ